MSQQRPLVIDADKFATLRALVDGVQLDLTDAARALGVTRIELAVSVAEHALSPEYSGDFEEMIHELGLAQAEILAATDRIECAEDHPGILRPQLIDAVGMQAFEPNVAISSILRVRNPVGAGVLARRPGEAYYYSGVIRSVAGDRLQVEFDAGDSAAVGPTDLLPLTWAAGDAVMVRDERKPTYQAANIIRVDGRSLDVEFSNGKKGTVATDRVRMLPIGAAILASGRDQLFYPARVVAYVPGGIYVAYDEGKEGTIPLAGARRLDVALGDFVFTRLDEGAFALPDLAPPGVSYNFVLAAQVLEKRGRRILCQIGATQMWTTLGMICVLLPGARVLALNSRERTLAPARVKQISETGLTVEFEAGGEASLGFHEIDRTFLQVGEFIAAKKLGVGNFLPAQIVKLDDAKALVRYADGNQAWADFADLRFEIPLPPANQASKPVTVADVARPEPQLDDDAAESWRQEVAVDD